MSVKSSTVVVAGTVAEEVELQARADGISIAAAVRQAAEKYVQRRQTDRAPRQETQQLIHNRKLLATRFPFDLVDGLNHIAYADGINLASEIRESLSDHLLALREDPDFQQRLQTLLERDQALAYRMCGVIP